MAEERCHSEVVLNYELLLEHIFGFLTIRDLQQCRVVSRKWRKVAHTVDMKRRTVRHYHYCFRHSREDNCVSILMEKYSAYKVRLPQGTESFEEILVEDIPSLSAPPQLMILIEGGNNKIGKKRRWKRAKVINAIRANLKPTCSVVGIDAHYGVISNTFASRVTDASLSRKSLFGPPLVVDHNTCGFFGITCSLFPSFKEINIEVFHRLSELDITEDIKGVVLFSSSVSFYGQYLEHPNVQELVDKRGGHLALAGAHINERIVKKLFQTLYSDDTANYYFVNGTPPYNPMFNPQQMSLIGIKLSGSKVRAASLSIETLDSKSDVRAELAHIEEKLSNFRKCISFNPDSNVNCEVVSFLFLNYYRYKAYVEATSDVNVAVDIFCKVFPKTKLIGLLSHAQYRYNHWDSISLEEKMELPRDANNLPTITPSTESIASLIIFSLEKHIE